MAVLEVTELLGDGIGPELRASVHAVAEALPFEIRFRPVDLSLENRRRRGSVIYDEAEAAMRETRNAVKYPTVTEDESPNAVLRRRLEFSVIYRPVFSMEGIDTHFTEEVFLHIVRIATGGTYEDPGRMVGDDAAVSLRIVERRPCRDAARFAFRLAQDKGLTVTSSSKHTIQKVTDGFFESVVRGVAEEFSGVSHQVVLFDALLAKIILSPGDYQVVLCLNEYGDFLSDMACGLVGSLGTGASASYSFDEAGVPVHAMFDPAGGTAPDIAGQDKANPTAALIAFSMFLDHAGPVPGLGRALRRSMMACIARGDRTPDLKGSLGTVDYTAAVVAELATRMTQL